MNSWGEPIHCSRRGASHWRRQQPCQDASASGHGLSLDGLPVWVMAVADGHGGSRYRLSDRGSRLACERALALVLAAVSQRRLGSPDDNGSRMQWAAWLSRELPAAITSAWLEAIAADWHANEPKAAEPAGPATPACEAATPAGSSPTAGSRAAAGQPFQPLLYGSTLGLVLMTPHWWGQTGLGDWDLVRIDGDGQASLLSEERQEIAAGEATCSLCQREAASLFAGRSGLWPIGAQAAPFALLLSTDGLRKSCASDPDFLLLARWLAGMPDPTEAPRGAELAASLDRISREGSGDDVSVAIGRLEPARHRLAPERAAASADSDAPTLPTPSADSNRSTDSAVSSETPAATKPASSAETAESKGWTDPSIFGADAPGTAGPARQETAASQPQPRTPGPSPARKPRALAVIGLTLVLAGVGVGTTALLLPWPRPDAPKLATATAHQALQQKAQQLCSAPETISRQLNRRRALIDQWRQQWHQQRPKPGWLQAQARRDPLAAWIAISLDPALPAARRRQSLEWLGACPALIEALPAATSLPAAPSAQQTNKKRPFRALEGS